MELYTPWSNQWANDTALSIKMGDRRFQANRKLSFKKTDVEGSVAATYLNCDAKTITQKTNYKRPIVESMPHEYTDTTPKQYIRDLSHHKVIKGTQVKTRPHHSYKSNYMPVD